MPNNATKSEVKKATNVDTSEFAKKTDLASLKSEVDKIYNEKLKTVLADLSKLCDAVKMLLLRC